MFSFSKAFKNLDENENLKLVKEKLKDNKTDIEKENEPIQQEVQKKVEDEWIWVEGYKGTDKNMQCYNEFQYELNKQFDMEDAKVGEYGFHFSKNIDVILKNYSIRFNNRFFKVKGLIKKEDYNDNNELSAKSIIFIKELNYFDLKDYINKNLIFIENEKEYNYCLNCNDYKNNYYNKLRKEKIIKQIKNLGFTELFSQLIYKKLEKINWSYCTSTKEKDIKYIDNLNIIKSFIEENISRDLLIYLIIEELNRLT